VDQTVKGNTKQGMHTERDVDIATSGAGSRTQEPLPAEAASHQFVVGDIPLEPPGFQAQPHVLAKLDRTEVRVLVIYPATGSPGLGTTQLAAAYARAKLAAGWRLVAWVNAAEAGSLQAGLAAVAEATGLIDGGSGPDIADAGRAVRHLLEADGDRCLLVFDDVPDLEALRPFIPADGTAQVLITSPRPPTANLATAVPVDGFSADGALSFLTGRAGLDDDAGAAAVAAVLGHMPLALALAAPVIRGQRHGYARYLERLQAIPAEVVLTGDDGQPDLHGVARAVLLSLAAIRAADKTGMSTRVLEIVAVLSAAGVRRELLHVAGRAGVLASGGHRIEAALVDQMLEWLGDRSLLTFSLDGQTVMVHRLVAQVVRARLVRRRRLGAVCWVAASVLEAHAIAVAGSQDRPAVRGIPQQVTALLGHTAEFASEADEELAELLLRLRFIALYHQIELGDTSQAIAVGEQLTADLERQLGPDHPDTSNARNSLAAAYLAAGRVTDAIPLFEQTLVIFQRQLGPDHPDTLTSQNNLASAYQDAGRVAEAIQLYEQNLALRERLPGPDHPSTMNSRGNLATAYLAAGRVTDAIALFEQTLAGRNRVLGSNHPDTQTSRKNLAKAYRAVGRVADAIPLEQTPAGRPPVLRPDHPDIRISQKNPATAYRDGGRPAEAIPPGGQTSAPRDSQAPADAAGKVLPASLRRPPADPARREPPAGFRRPPADPARRPLSDRAVGASAELSDHSSPSGTQDPPLIDAEHDREMVVAIMAEDPAGMAMAYDSYAAGLYGYCHWMLGDSAAAAESLQDTFVLALATLSDLPESAKLRPWLFALARNECRRRSRLRPVTRDEVDAANQRADEGHRTDEGHRADEGQRADDVGRPTDATVPPRAIGEPADDPDATMVFRVASEPAHDPDATMVFPAAGVPVHDPDATVVLRVASEPVQDPDVTVVLRVASEPVQDPDATMVFRVASEPVQDPDATMVFRVPSKPVHDPDATVILRMASEPVHDPDATMKFRMVSPLADATMPLYVVSKPTDPSDDLADANGPLGQAELRVLIRSILADLKPREREVIELSFRHDLYDNDLAIALGVSWSRAHALAERARGRLEKSFGVLRTALAGREACPVMGELLAEWDGQLTEQTRDLVVWHIEQCQTCANRERGALRPTALFGLLPLVPLPPDLREQVLSCCLSQDEDAVAYRRRVVRRPESTWSATFSQAIRRVSWDSIRANPGAAIAASAVALWVAAAVSVTLLIFAGSHAAAAPVPRPAASISSSRPAAAPASVDGRASAQARQSPAVRQSTARP
jgi:RNA polymerase sigma factor (sigma-70 family)